MKAGASTCFGSSAQAGTGRSTSRNRSPKLDSGVEVGAGDEGPELGEHVAADLGEGAAGEVLDVDQDPGGLHVALVEVGCIGRRSLRLDEGQAAGRVSVRHLTSRSPGAIAV